MAEKKKDKKPKAAGDAKPKGGGKKGGCLRPLVWTLALVLVYALSLFPVRLLFRHWRDRPEGVDLAAHYLYLPLSWLRAVEPVREFYDRGFKLLGVD